MKLYYFNLNTSKFPKSIKESFKYEREINYYKGMFFDIPIVVIKTDESLVEDVLTHDTYSLEDKSNILNGYILREINYEEYNNLIDLIDQNDKQNYISFMKNLHNILIEKENIKKEKNNKSNKERLLVV